MKTSFHLNWVFVALLSAACFAVMASCIRIASKDLPEIEIIFFRNFLGLILLLPIALRRNLSFRTKHLGLHLFRALSGTVAMYLYFYAIVHLPLADAVLLNYTSPLFVSFFSVVLLKEKLTPRRRLSGILGMTGMVCLFHPSSAIASFAGVAGLSSGIMAGLALTSVKKLSDTDPSLTIVIIYAFFASLFSGFPLLWHFTAPSGQAWLWLVAVGGLGSLGQLCLAQSYKLAPASQVSPLGYSGILFASLIGFLAWNEHLDHWMVLGMVFIITAGVLVARERIEPMPVPPSATPEFPVTRPS